MGKKKGNKSESKDNAYATSSPSLLFLARPVPNVPLLAVIEFHHMLIGNTHKKEVAAISAAASHGVCGFIFMGGPSLAIIEALALDDVLGWLADCKKAGKEGKCVYWKEKHLIHAPRINNKLKFMGYAPGKDTKMDTETYKATLSQVGIAFPLPPSAPLY